MELGPVDRITVGAIGEPGQRTFFIQARTGVDLITLLVDKQQVQLLSASLVDILSRLTGETGKGPPEESMDLEQPIEPRWRVGRIAIGYEEDRDLLLLEAEEQVPEEEVAEPGHIRLWASREQMLALARHGAAVCAAGRPKCEFCGNPMEADEHICPAMNGHGGTS